MDTEQAATSQAEEAAISTTQAVAETTTQDNAQTVQATTAEENPEVARLRAELEKTRKEAASHRVKLREFEQAQMSEEEKRAARLQELEQENQRLAQTAKRNAINAAIAAESVTLGIKPTLAQKLVSQEEIEFDEDGTPKNVAKLLQKLVRENPELTGAVAGGAVNPTRTASGSQADYEAEIRAKLTTQTFNPFGLDNAQQNPAVIRSG